MSIIEIDVSGKIIAVREPWYDLIDDSEWTYQAVTMSRPKPRLCPYCGAVMRYYYGWFCTAAFPDLASVAQHNAASGGVGARS